jgi:hypothetical protein
LEIRFLKNKKLLAILMLVIIGLLQLSSFAYFPGEADVDESGNLILRSTIENNETAGSWNKLILKYRNFIVGFSGIAALTMLLNFIINFTKLGANATNPNKRHEIIVSLVFTGVATMLLGAVSIIVGLFYNIFV